ncbi:MAG TPA: DUF6512 family protein [Oscillospiraceae bacterium]|nr:DUF6512 family protein [Oscillospiraceae bacterium]
MNNQLLYWEIAGFLFVIIFGTLLHFVYQWSGNNKIVGLFAPVNESTWEHLKLLFTPMVLFSIVEYFAVGKNYTNYIPAKALGILLGMITIVVIFYTYTGILGKNYLWADILTFILGVAVAYAYSWKMIHKPLIDTDSQIIGIMIILILILSFALFSYYPPHIPIFLDPVTKNYGPSSHTKK